MAFMPTLNTNTSIQLLQRQAASLYGSRGSGKYSLVKALLNKFGNLRLIEVAKSNLKNLPAIIEQLRDVPQKFIIFVDAWDTMQEKLDFSDSFGLTLTFSPPNQNTYLEIVRHMATQAGISLPREDLGDREHPSFLLSTCT
ncbi:MAG: DUF815 domain-containing protein [Hormoscilla sp. GM7CHS1pb]|nr:DUF815 domain-containing protein [Hormoscilla sp. GM7CHS1pb]